MLICNESLPPCSFGIVLAKRQETVGERNHKSYDCALLHWIQHILSKSTFHFCFSGCEELQVHIQETCKTAQAKPGKQESSFNLNLMLYAHVGRSVGSKSFPRFLAFNLIKGTELLQKLFRICFCRQQIPITVENKHSCPERLWSLHRGVLQKPPRHSPKLSSSNPTAIGESVGSKFWITTSGWPKPIQLGLEYLQE